ncbi:MAG: hypothetical protein AAF586_08145 [Planctomycetota bacterium]
MILISQIGVPAYPIGFLAVAAVFLLSIVMIVVSYTIGFNSAPGRLFIRIANACCVLLLFAALIVSAYLNHPDPARFVFDPCSLVCAGSTSLLNLALIVISFSQDDRDA